MDFTLRLAGEAIRYASVILAESDLDGVDDLDLAPKAIDVMGGGGLHNFADGEQTNNALNGVGIGVGSPGSSPPAADFGDLGEAATKAMSSPAPATAPVTTSEPAQTVGGGHMIGTPLVAHRVQRQRDSFAYRVADATVTAPAQAPETAEDILNEFKGRRDRWRKDVKNLYTGNPDCIVCNGAGWEGSDRCRGCGGSGAMPTPANAVRKIGPWANRLEKALYGEFMDWWHTPGAERRKPEEAHTNWRIYPHEPVTHWLNVEDFLNERHPHAATGAIYGWEYANPLLHDHARGQGLTPDELEESGYSSNGNVITQAMLNLHNRLQGRKWESKHDQRRYFELMLKHIGPKGKPVKAAGFSFAMADTSQWHPLIKHDGSEVGGDAYGSGKYSIRIPDESYAWLRPAGKVIAELTYSKMPTHTGIYRRRQHPEVYIDGIIVHPEHRGKGVAQALVERLAKDHPEHKINPGSTTPQGTGFTERMLELHSDQADRLIPDYEPHVLDDEDTRAFESGESRRLQFAMCKQSLHLDDEEAAAFLKFVEEHNGKVG